MTQKTPAQLTVSTTVAATDLYTGYPVGGPMYAITAPNLRTYMTATAMLLDGTQAMTAAFPGYAGSEATPGIGFSADPDTGFYRSAANTFIAVTGGLGRVRFDSTGLTALNGAIWTGPVTGDVTGNASGNAGTATKLATGRTISATGSIALTTGAFDGSANVTGTATIQNNSDAVTWGGLQTYSAGANLTIATAPATNAVGYLGMPQHSVATAYTLVMSDIAKDIYHTSATPHTITIDSNANVAMPIGAVGCITAASGSGAVTVAITSDTLRWVPAGTTGSRTVTAPGFLAWKKVAATEIWCWGLNVT